jgi:hypothetical protein
MDQNNQQLHAHNESTPVGKTKGKPSWTGAPLPRDSMRMARHHGCGTPINRQGQRDLQNPK